ncbi:MAG: PKD domain-containing protein [Acidobacteriota bacterium]
MASPSVAVEPGSDEFLSKITSAPSSSRFQESYEGFSGSYLLRMVDISLPGKAGLDLVVQRTYQPNIWNRTEDDPLIEEFIYHQAGVDPLDLLGGNGWQLHMGKVRNPFGTGSSGTDILPPDNPSVLMPDGSSYTLYLAADGDGMVSREGWRYRRISGPAEQPVRWELTQSDGTIFVFESTASLFLSNCFAGPCYALNSWDEATSYVDFVGTIYAQCTEIRDVHGNKILIDYDQYWGRIETLTDTYGREVELSYHDGSPDGSIRPRLKELKVRPSSNSSTVLQTVKYGYASSFKVEYELGLVTLERDIYRLSDVTPPEGNAWAFKYRSGSVKRAAGRRALETVTFPSGVEIKYTYKGVAFDVGHASQTVEQAALEKKMVSGAGLTTGTWNYDYADPGEEGQVTTITGPEGFTETQTYHGWGDFDEPSPRDDMEDVDLWKVGLLASRVTELDGETRSQTFTYEAGRLLSADWQHTTPWNGFLGADLGRFQPGVSFVRPQEVKTEVVRDSETYSTTQSDFDEYGNPLKITETGGVERTTTLAYWYNEEKGMIAGRLASRVSSPGGSESRKYSDVGLETQRTVNGSLVTDFTYHATGDLESQTLKNDTELVDLTRTWSGYTWGVPTQVTEGPITFTHTANELGLLAKEDDGRGNTTAYTHDDLGRVTKLEPPVGTLTEIIYSPDGRTVTVRRGAFDIVYTFDGLDRLTQRLDKATSDALETTYNALGGKEEEKILPGGVIADTRSFDLLGRLTQVTRADATTVTASYEGAVETLTDEEEQVTIRTYEAFGDPDDRRLVKVEDPLENEWTYGYDAMGRLDSVDAPGTGFDRSFGYNAAGLLASETHPESGTTTYGYDAAGQRTSRLRGAEETLYSYDTAGRLTAIDTPEDGHDVAIGYIGTLRQSVTNGSAGVTFGYDTAGRLTQRTNTISGRDYAVTFGYDDFDRLTSTTYDSGRVVNTSYNSQSRISEVESGGVKFAAGMTYHSGGGLSQLTNEGVVSKIGYDTRLRPESLDILRGATSLVDLDFKYDGVGNLEIWTDDHDPTASRTLDYDALGRLTSAEAGGLWGSRVYGYDAHGNRTSLTLDGIEETYVYGPSGRLTSAGAASFGYDAFGRMTSATREVAEPPPPPEEVVAIFSASCNGLVCRFDAAGSGSPVGLATYEWEFGDGASATLSPPDSEVEHTYAAAGARTVRLTVTDSAGDTAVASQTVQPVDVDFPPSASFTYQCADDTPSCELDASSSSDDRGIVSYGWNFGDGTSSSATEPRISHVFPAIGNYNVTLTVTDTGGLTHQQTRAIEMVTAPIVVQLRPGNNARRDEGALVLAGWAASPAGIAAASITTFHDLSVLTADYGAPDPAACEWIAEHFGWRDPNCPNVGFYAVVDTRPIAEGGFPRSQAIAHLRFEDGVDRHASKILRTWVPVATDDKYPLLGLNAAPPDPAEAIEIKGRTELLGWAADDSGVAEILLAVDGTAWPATVRRNVSRFDACDRDINVKALGDPNCGAGLIGWAAILDPAGLTLGEHTLTITARDLHERELSIDYPIRVLADPQPFFGTPQPIPTLPAAPLEFETFDRGGPGVAYFDTTPTNGGGSDFRAGEQVDLKDCCGGHVVLTQTTAGEWLEYTVEVAASGFYDLQVAFSDDANTGSFRLLLDGAALGAALATHDTGPSTWAWLDGGTVYLESTGGPQTLRLEVLEGGFNLNRLRLEVAEDPIQQAYLGLVRPLPGELEGEHFDQAVGAIGQSVAYFDRDRDNRLLNPVRGEEWVECAVRRGRVSVETEAGEWLEYTVEVTAAGMYDLAFDYLNDAGSDAGMEISANGASVAFVNLPAVDGSWQRQVVSGVELAAGQQILRLTPSLASSPFQLDRLQVSSPSQPLCTPTGESFVVLPGETLSLSIAGDLLANDDGENLVFAGLVIEPLGSLSWFGDDLTYRAPEDRETDRFVYRAAGDGCLGAAEVTIDIDTAPRADFNFDCAGLSCAFDASAAADDRAIVAYAWRFGDGAIGSGREVERLFSLGGTYTVSLEVTDASGQTASADRAVDLDPPPVATFTVDCSGLVCDFDGSDSHDESGITNWSWDFGDGEVALDSVPLLRHVYATGILRTVTLTVSDGVQSATVSRLLLLDRPPVAQLIVACDDLDCTFDASASNDDGGIVIYRWDFGDGSAPVETNTSVVAHDYQDEGTYEVRLTVVDAVGQEGRSSAAAQPEDFLAFLLSVSRTE